MFITPAYTIKYRTAELSGYHVVGYAHHGDKAGLIAKGLSLAEQHHVFVVVHEDAPDTPVQHWANGHRI